MKKHILHLGFILLMVFCLTPTHGQPPPPPAGGHGAAGNQESGGAPIGSGLFILLGLGAAYGGKKIYMYFRKLEVRS